MNEGDTYLQLETQIVRVLKDIYDPEIPVNVYDLGLIYDINVSDDKKVSVTMTLTAPNCPMADSLIDEIKTRVGEIPGVREVKVNLTFDPPWDMSNLSEEARLELGFL